MSQTKKQVLDSILQKYTRWKVTDELSLDPDHVYYLIDQERARLIQAQYAETQEIDRSWLSPPTTLNVTPTNYPDNIISIDCPKMIGKSTIPQVISLFNRDAGVDIGVYSLISMCGNRFRYSFKPRQMWSYIPSDHVYSKFQYYDRVNQLLYISNTPEKLLFTGVLLTPEDGYLVNSTPIASGFLVNGVTYFTSGGQIIYNGAVIAEGTTFVANATATFITSTGVVYLNSQVASYRDIDPYPASGDMIRQIEENVLNMLFMADSKSITETRNDSADEKNKIPQV